MIVSAIAWLENDQFLMAHTPSISDSAEGAPTTTYNFVSRDATGNCTFQRLPEVCRPGFGPTRLPPFQFIQRLLEFPPNLQDMVIVTSTASDEVGFFTRVTRKTLAADSLPDRLTDVFTTTTLADDSRRAGLPLAPDGMSETSPIGMALDLSSKDNVHRPLPGEEIDETKGPLPGLMILNNLGVLSAWWVAYADSIREGVPYPHLSMYEGHGQTQPQVQSQTSVPTPSSNQNNALSQNLFGSSANQSMLGAPSKPTAAFGAASTTGGATPSFGSPGVLGGAQPTFSSTSALGPRASTWGATTSQQTGGATFGQTSFGNASALGSHASPWASSGTGAGAMASQSSTPGAQSSPFTSTTSQPIFGSSTTPATGSGSGFASFASGGGFAAAAAKSVGGSVLQQSTPNKSFTSEMDTTSPFGSTPREGAFNSGSFGLGSGGFQVGSAWKNENASKETVSQSPVHTGGSLFGNDFGKALGNPSTGISVPQSNEADMGDLSETDEPNEAAQNEVPKSPEDKAAETTTPADTPAAHKFLSAPPVGSGLFGTQAQDKGAPAAEVEKSEPTSMHAAALEEKATPDKVVTQANDAAPQEEAVPQAEPTPAIKKEPEEDDSTLQKQTTTPSQPPLPPDITSKATFTPDTSSATSSASASKQIAEDAPLPPDFTKPGNKADAIVPTEDLPLPAEEPAPLPPDFVKTKAKAQPPQTPTDAPPSSIADKSDATEAEDTTEETAALPDDDESLDDEGSGVDVAEEITEETSPKITPESSFGGKQAISPIGEPFAKVTQPKQPQPAQKSLFGEVSKGNKMPVFPPPSKLQESPRSPSPVRSVPPDLLRPDNQRSVSAPGVPATKGLRRSMIQVPRPDKSFEERQKAEQARRAEERERQRQEEEQSLSDREDEDMRDRLAAAIEPTLDLEPFVAHTDYNRDSSKPGIPGQIERVYRDINSMIDTLGINSRSLQSFIKGHSEYFKQSGRDKDDLHSKEDWCLVEVEDLSTLENTLGHELEDGRLLGIEEKVASIQTLQQDLAKLLARQNDAKRVLDSRTNPETLESQWSMPLSAEQSIQRHDLRRDFATFQTSLCKAEEAISVLRAKLAASASSSFSASTSSLRSRKPTQKVPTVEAVENTIRKMTAMAERKSGDIDVLETQMRRLGVRSPSPAPAAALLADSPYNSRASSPANFVTPPTSARKPFRNSAANGSASAARSSAFYTPKSSMLGASAASYGATPSKSPRRTVKLGDMSEQEVRQFADRLARRKGIKDAIRTCLINRGEVKVRALGE